MRNLRRLEYFIAVAEELHFGKAAERLHIAQPGLSQQIKALEQELGTQLLIRDRRSVELTPAGAFLLTEGRAFLRAADELAVRVHQHGAGVLGAITIVHSRSALNPAPLAIVQKFHAEFPGVQVHSLHGWTSRNLELLLAHEADVAFVRTPVTAPGIEVCNFAREELVVVIPSGHPLAKRRRVLREDIRDEPIVFWPRSQSPGFFDASVQDVWPDEPPNIVLEEPDAELIVLAVASGAGLAVLDRHRAERLRPKGVVLRRFGDPVPTGGVGVAWRSEDSSPVVQVFLALVRTYSTEVAHDDH